MSTKIYQFSISTRFQRSKPEFSKCWIHGVFHTLSSTFLRQKARWGKLRRFFKNYFILDISTPRSRVNYKTNHLYSIQCNTTQGLKDLMRERGRVEEGQRHVLPPQIFNGEQYRGVGFSFPQNLHFSPHDYDGFDLLRFRTMMGLIWQMRTMCWRNFLALTGNIPKWVFSLFIVI